MQWQICHFFFTIIPFIIQKCWYSVLIMLKYFKHEIVVAPRNVCVCETKGEGGGRVKTTKSCLFGLLHFKFRFWIIYGSVYVLVAVLYVSVHRMASAAPSKWIRMEKLLTSELFIQINLNDGEYHANNSWSWRKKVLSENKSVNLDCVNILFIARNVRLWTFTLRRRLKCEYEMCGTME